MSFCRVSRGREEKPSVVSGTFGGGGVTERGGGLHSAMRGTMFVRNGAVTPGPSRECGITFFVKGRPKSA